MKHSTSDLLMNQPQHRGPLLGQLCREEWESILVQCTTRRYAKGDQIVREMEQNNNMYFIDRGAVQVTLFSQDGREVSFATLEQGQNFGEISVIDGKPRSANVIALTETDMIIMPPKVFQQILHTHPAIAVKLLEQLSAMIRRLCERIFEYSTSDVKHRIYAELLRLGKHNIDLDGIVRISNPPTHAQLASRVSCHREAVSRELKSLEKEGILARKDRKLLILKIQILQAMVEQVMGRQQPQLLPSQLN